MRDEEVERRRGRAEDVALFRYSLIREAADPKLSKAKRGLLVRALADGTHRGPDGEPVRVSRQTLDRWVRESAWEFWRLGRLELHH